MKKIRVFGVIAILSVFALMSIGSGSESDSGKKEITAQDSSEEAAAAKNDADEAGFDEADSDDASLAAGDEAETDEVRSDATIEEQVLFEQDDVKVTATGLETDPIWGEGIKLLVENNGTKDIGVGCNALIVNDYMISDLFSTTIAAGKKDYETLRLSSDGLKAAGIENIGRIEIYFHTFDADSYMTISDIDCVTIETSAVGSMDETPNDSGQELYSEDGIRIVGKYVDEDSFWGAAVLLYIENESSENKIIQCDDMSVNGFMVTPYFSQTVYAGKKSISEITLMSSELEENNITSVDDIELKFKIIDEDFMNSKESDVISFSAR